MRRLLAVLLVAIATVSFAASNETSGNFTTSDNVRLHYIEAGKGRAIVFIPGWTMPAEIWQPQIDALSAKYRVIAVDPRSQGDSDKVADGNYPERHARDIQELVDHLKLQKPVLVGWSLGAEDVLSYVDQFGTANIGAVVLVDEFIKTDPQLAASYPRYLLKFQMDRRANTEAFVRSMYRKPQSDAYIAQIAADSLKMPTNSAMAMMMGSLGRLDWSDALAKMDKVPVQYHFEPYLKSQADLIKQKFPFVQLIPYDDAGHALFVDDADRFNHELEELMQTSK